MFETLLAALIITQSPATEAQSSGAIGIQPNTDSAEQRAALRNLSICLAKARPRWAQETLSHPYLSTAQASSAAQALSGTDRCIRGAEADVTFRTSSLVGGLAEHFIATGQSIELNSLAGALATIKPLNASEDFALCVAVRDPTAARALALSEPGSEAETSAAQRLAHTAGSCVGSGEKPSVELQSLRALTSVALYRAMTGVSAARR